VGRLDDRVAIITGSGRGIGRATALRFAEEGASVVVNDVDPDPAEETAEEIRKNGGQAVVAIENTVEFEAAAGSTSSSTTPASRGTRPSTT
jgi:3-oxoacyl-[acyl-carrier protein] reductase